MPNTSEGFYYPDANTNIAPLETVLANMAASSDSVAQQTPAFLPTTRLWSQESRPLSVVA